MACLSGPNGAAKQFNQPGQTACCWFTSTTRWKVDKERLAAPIAPKNWCEPAHIGIRPEDNFHLAQAELEYHESFEEDLLHCGQSGSMRLAWNTKQLPTLPKEASSASKGERRDLVDDTMK